MTSTYASLAGLRRIPQQSRSMARVDAVIDALFTLVAEFDRPSEITTADVAARAGVPIGSLYEYFEDLDGIVDAALSVAMERHDELLEHLGRNPPRDLRQLVDALFDTYLQLYTELPGFLALRNSTLFERHHGRLLQDRVNEFVRTVARSGTATGVFSEGPDTAERLEFLFSIGDATLQAFLRHRANGDDSLLEESRAIIQYATRRVVDGTDS